MIVMKFGGTSVESAAAIERVASIVKARLDRRPVVIVSAMGKTTNALLAMAQAAAAGRKQEALDRLSELRAYHECEIRPLVRNGEWPEALRILNAHFDELAELLGGLVHLGEFPPRSVDAVSSYGERLSSALIAVAFRNLGIDAAHVDSREIVVTDNRHTGASPVYDATYSRFARKVGPLAQERVVVMGGFIGATPAGVTTTLGRGGSDFSAAIAGAGLGAEEIQIWTDVDGMLTADPRILPGGHRVRTISFAEAAELAYFGAKVLHPATVLPAMERNIPVLILNSRRPDAPGTRIVNESVPCKNLIKSIACKRNVTVVNIHSTRMLGAHGFLRRIFEVFDRFATPVDVVSTSEVSVSLTIDSTENLAEICGELRQFAEVETESGRAIVCLVGDNIRYTPGVAGRAFHAVESINLRMISQGASRLNLTFVVAEQDLERAVRLLHAEFFREPDPAVFDLEAAS